MSEQNDEPGASGAPDRGDVDRLLRLIGMLGSPSGGFWDSWRTDMDGYAFAKMKTFVTRCAEPDAPPALLSFFGSYVLKFFSSEDADAEAALVERVRAFISGHAENQPAIQFLNDLRATAWRLMRDNSGVRAETVAAAWGEAER
ncbi:hypothetical protein ABZ569_33425 [Streptomyces albus]|uniref:hypothetical protein n=1 Tax=Streptomyces albus TaxID=1888 RepID=UPI0033FFB4EA